MTRYNNVSPRFIKTAEFKYFHVFTDNKDSTFNITSSYNESRKAAFEYKDKLLKQGEQNIRVYYVHEIEDHRDGEIIQLEETCIYSKGNFPY